MTKFRLNRLFDPLSGRLVDVAVDHGFFGERAFLTGIEDMTRVVHSLVESAPDAIQLTLGQAPLLQAIPGKRKPSLILRGDVANVYGDPLASHLFSVHVVDAVAEAVRLDAVAICVNLMDLPGRPEIREQNIRSIITLRAESAAAGMPLMIEPLVMKSNGGGYGVEGDVDRILPLVRQAVELGADLIKADPSDDIEEYHRVIEVAAPVPVLVRGGGRVSDEELLRRTAAVIGQGARGIVYGRNIVQHPNPRAITRALMDLTHDRVTVHEALAALGREVTA